MDPRTGRCGDFGPRQFFARWLDELIAFAGHQFDLSVVQEDGACLRDHLLVAAVHSEAAAEQLRGPPCPQPLAHLWAWFVELSAGRSRAALAWPDVEAWCRLSRIAPSAFELSVLRALDAEYLRIMSAPKGK